VSLGGGSSDGGSSDGGSVDVPSDGGLQGTRSYLVEAPVASDSCGERVSAVNQTFTVSDSGSGVIVDTSLVKVAGTEVNGTISAGFSESNGSCSREYKMNIDDVNSSAPLATLTAKTTCGGTVCSTVWRGSASEVSSKEAVVSADVVEKVRGDECNPNIPQTLGYRPSLFECNGNSALLLSGSLRNNYSIVFRRDGQFNDRDPKNPTCGSNRCSPFKTQKRIELPDYQVNCMGDTGFSANYSQVIKLSIKFSAAITNANDTSQFEQYCFTRTTASLH